MEEAEVKVLISQGNTFLREWKVHSSNLPEILSSLKNLKESVNDFLTDLICKEKNSRSKKFLGEIKELHNVQEEDESLEEDPLTEILEEIMKVNDSLSQGEDIKKICYNSQPKRLKK